ncbi:MAG: FHA domain-containing protein [Planctomycetota bacterium]
MASLIVISGPQQGDYYRLDQQTNVIGRAETNPVQILDEKVSRKHLKIHFDPDKQQYRIHDMRSKAGVFVNGRKLDSESTLADGDKIRIGQTTLLFTVKDFDDRESAFSHYRKSGEWVRETNID